MNDLLSLIRDERQPIGDFLRFSYDIWYLPDGTYPKDDLDKFINQKLTVLTKKSQKRLDDLFGLGVNDGYSLESCKQVLRRNLSSHTEIIRENFRLQQLIAAHTESDSLSVKSERGQEFDAYLQKTELNGRGEFVVFRTLSQDLLPVVQEGDRYVTTDIWAASYNPISSFPYGILRNQSLDQKIYVLRICLPASFVGGLLVENNEYEDATNKQECEFVLASGLRLTVQSIQEKELIIPDSKGGSDNVWTKVYNMVI